MTASQASDDLLTGGLAAAWTSPVTTRRLDAAQLAASPSVVLDDALRTLPGLELFRRSSSLVANPTSQGMSLRGLGSTAASRSLLVLDEEPLNDVLGGWIHWNELPTLAIDHVELLRGGLSDLYGSAAIGGVLRIEPARPTDTSLALRATGGGEATLDQQLRGSLRRGAWGALAAAGLTATDGYIQEAPAQRGPIDTPSNVHSQNALTLAERDTAPLRLFARATGLNEQRNNGTPDQWNRTRLVRYATGADLATASGRSATVRLYGSSQRYRQIFSAIGNAPIAGLDPGCTYRCSETRTRFAYVADNELGAAAHATQPLGAHLVVVAGTDLHDVRLWDREQTTAATALQNDHQRTAGVYAEALATADHWTLSAALREDRFRNFDPALRDLASGQWTAAALQPAASAESLPSPRMGLSRQLGAHFALSASGFRAFRAPTPSELYRSTQVGNKLTNPNWSLRSERAIGWEAGVAAENRRLTTRLSWFSTEVNRPIVAVTTNPSSSPILLVRENLGRITSRGLSLDAEAAPLGWLRADGGYQYAHATVTAGPQDLGNWIPEVARNMATLNLTAERSQRGLLRLESRISGRQFDDDANAYLLHGYFRLDGYASHSLGRVSLFAAAENLLGRSIEVAKTPTTTLGQPRLLRVGFQLRLGPACASGPCE